MYGNSTDSFGLNVPVPAGERSVGFGTLTLRTTVPEVEIVGISPNWSDDATCRSVVDYFEMPNDTTIGSAVPFPEVLAANPLSLPRTVAADDTLFVAVRMGRGDCHASTTSAAESFRVDYVTGGKRWALLLKVRFAADWE
jgi:hypothetical protein